MALNVGELYARLRLDMRGFTEAIASSKAALIGLQGAAVAAGASIVAVGAVGAWGVSLNANLEQSTISFKTLLGSAEEAKAMIADLKEFAKQTPFEYAGIEKVSMSLLNAGLPANELKDNLTKLGDAVSASGGNIQEKLEGAGVAIGQMAMKGKISAEEMQQLAERGLPAWEALAQATGKSKQELMDMGAQGKLMSDEYLPKLIDGLGKMRQGAMLEQSKTFLGMFGAMKDEVKAFVQEITGGAFDRVKMAFTMFVAQMEKMKDNETLIKLKENIQSVFNGIANIIIYFTQTIAPIIVAVFAKVVAWFADNMPTIQSVMAEVTRAISTMIQILAGTIGIIFDALAMAIGWIVDNAKILIPVLSTLTMAVLGGIAAWKLYTFWVGIAPTVIGIATTAIALLRSGMLLATIQMYAAIVATRLWSIAMSLNPIGLIVIGIGALIGAIVAVIYWVKQKTSFFEYMFAYIKTTYQQVGNILKLFLLTMKDNFLMLSNGFLIVIEKIAWGMNKIGLMSDESYSKIKNASNDATQSMRNNQEEIVRTQDNIRSAYVKTREEVEKNVEAKKKAAAEEEAIEKAKETSAEDALKAEEEKRKKIEQTIQLAKAGVVSAIADVKKLAQAGVVEALNALSEIDNKYLQSLMKAKQAQMKALVEQLNIIKAMMATQRLSQVAGGVQVQDQSGSLTYTDRSAKTVEDKKKADKKQISNMELEIANLQKIIDNIKSSSSSIAPTKLTAPSPVTPKSKETPDKKEVAESAQKKAFEESMKYIQRKKDFNQISLNEEYSAYVKMQSKLNKATKEGSEFWWELEKKKLDVVRDVSQKIIADAQTRISRMAKLSRDGARTEITEIEKLLAKSEVIGEERAKIEADLWDKKVDYAKDASDKILDKTLADIEKAKNADLNAIEDVYDAKRKQIEDIFNEQEKSEDKKKQLDELSKLREQESIFSSATSKKGREQLAKIREDIQNLMNDMKKDANEQLKNEMLGAIDSEEEAAKKKAEARAEALKKDAETKAGQVEASLINIATKTGNTMQTLVDTINGYQGSFYKAGAGLVEQFGLGMGQFEPKADKLKDVIEKIKNANSAMDIQKNLEFGSQIAGGIGSQRMLKPMNNSNNKTTNYNAPLISIQSVTLKDKVDADAWAKESAGYLELATRKMGR